MPLFQSKEERATRAIKAFWDWFAQLQGRYGSTDVSQGDAVELGKRLTKAGPGLVFQIDPGSEPKVLEISADGIRDRFPLVRKVVSMAPEIPGWRIVAFRQPIQNPAGFTIEFGSVSLHADDLTFAIRPIGKRAGILVFVPTDESEVSKPLIGAVILLLDATLGEYDVETKLTIEGILPKSREVSTAKPLSELRGAVSEFQGEPI